MMTPQLSRRVGRALSEHWNSFDERDLVVHAAERVRQFGDLSRDVQALISDIESRPLVLDGDVPATTTASALHVFHLPGHHDQHSHGHGGGQGIRTSLADAKTTGEIGAAASAEAKRITGRDIEFDFGGSDPGVAREYAEGVLQGLERFPEAPLGAVRTTRFPGEASGTHTYGTTREPHSTASGKFEIEFNNDGRTLEEMHQVLEMKQARGQFAFSSPIGVAHHEFGHVIAEGYGTTGAARQVATEHALRATGSSDYQERKIFIMREISFYAKESDHELAAEAFADVMGNGSGASKVSHAIFDEIANGYARR